MGLGETVEELLVTNIEQNGLQRLVYGLSPLVSYLDENSVDCAPLFKAADIPPQSLGVPGAMMRFRQERIFTQQAIEVMEDPGLGLKIGSRYNLSAYGMLGLAIMSSATLIEGLRAITRLHGLTWSRLYWRLLLDRGKAILEGREVESLGSCSEYMAERDFVCTALVCSEMLGVELPLNEVRFSHKAPTHASEYESAFKCPVRFSAEKNELLFDAHWLKTPLPRANQAVYQVSYAQCEDLVARLADNNSYAQMIECLIVDGSGNFLSLNEVTEKLHISPRTLRRRLAEENTNFQSIVTDVRIRLAKDLLLNRKLSIEVIAERLGYSDSASFNHAFKRWTGKPPTMFR